MDGRIFIVADIHGQSSVVKNIISSIQEPTSKDIIIVAGDAGFEYGSHIMGATKRAARKFAGTWLIMRGNHDNCYQSDHSHWNDEQQCWETNDGWAIAEDGYCLYQEKYPNIWYLPDCGGILKIKDFNFLFCPGAYSVDKYYRLRMEYPYNQNEQLTSEEMVELYNIVKYWNEKNLPIDYVVGHTFPSYLEYTFRDLFLPSIPQNSVDKTTERWLTSLSNLYENNYAFKQYFGGHFHDSRRLNKRYRMVYQEPFQIE
jgi:3-oxoacid CoA-transferase subunit A